MVCIYHSKDMDGFTSGAIVKRRYPDAKLIGFDYSQKLPMEQIPKGEQIIMIDVSLPMSEMLSLAKHSGGNLTWIDHHISAINNYEQFINKENSGVGFLNAVLENGVSACEIGWRYLFPDEETPKAVKLLGEYDTWRNQDKERWENEILPFQFGIRQVCNSPETFHMGLLENNTMVNDTIQNGKVILQYQTQINERQCKNASFEYTFEGLRAICLNGGGFNSQVFDSVYDESKHDLMMPFQFNGDKWVISLYTTKDEVDCSVIAKSKGGGGHKKAAGFQVKNIKEVFDII